MEIFTSTETEVRCYTFHPILSPSIYISIYLAPYVTFYLSIYLCNLLSFYLSIYLNIDKAKIKSDHDPVSTEYLQGELLFRSC